MQFSWSKKDSRKACICLVVARVKCKGIDLDQAVHETLQHGHAKNPEAIPYRELMSLKRDAQKFIEKNSRCGISTSDKGMGSVGGSP
ncbi:hypothetical protein WJ0W_005777 [Paenibacillus melissococcoides]|uniref:Uncharacterized protein n=1 Tax=Paenibacillus melissococcoides TaxID=2912268 RepID=A0ABM9G9F9_9BACL|nr:MULTISPECIES: hypothetical protein [Paenibacillus]MEB9896788.1 hypothetical protein [Bacillus cereus]CAH8248593.1 hypothetical protein WJ0W_005777 [Paenibacillus melissococcoides]CAH8714306.1 hypothetical protein WDD9_003835 [Paenibacillus melissococcoides]CAH8719928.1 hypothetical protein HTL2_005772 [Paenibacillus melissococcoides]GIO79577.1 hypothetical protein J6TS7_31870 [Paenibacillus dendritiformis]